MKFIKCKNCVLLDKCPSGQRCVNLIEDFTRICPVGTEKDIEDDDKELDMRDCKEILDSVE